VEVNKYTNSSPGWKKRAIEKKEGPSEKSQKKLGPRKGRKKE